MEENQSEITAWHESAHAICGQSLGYVIARVSIEPSIERIGFCGAAPHLSGLAAAVWYLSGPCGEARYRQSIGLATDYRGSVQDFDDVHRVVSALVPDLPRATLFDTPIFKTAWDDAMKLVDGLAEEIDSFADALLQNRTLVGSALQDALAGRPVKSTAEIREELDRVAADLKQTRRPVSPMQDNAAAMFGKMVGHCFKDDVLSRHGIGCLRSNAERLAIVNENQRLMGPSVARRTTSRPAADKKNAAVRARARRAMNELNERHAAE